MIRSFIKKKTAIFLICALIPTVVIFCIGFLSHSHSAPKAERGYLDLSDWDLLEDGNIKMDGEWEFYWDRFVEYDQLSDQMRPDLYGKVPNTWSNYSLDGENLPGKGYGTYRLRIKTDLEPGTVLGFHFNTLSSSYRLFVNDIEIGSRGAPASAPGNTQPELRPLTVDFPIPAGEFDLILYVSNYHHARGGLWYSLTMGSGEGIAALGNGLEGRQLFVTGLIIFMALTSFCLFAMRVQAKDYLYLSLLALVLIITIDTSGQFLLYRIFPDIAFRWVVFLWYASSSWAVTMLVVFTEELYPARFTKQIVRAILVYTGVLTLIYMLVPVHIYTSFVSVLNIIDFAQLLFVIYLLFLAVRRGAVGSWVYLVAFVMAVSAYVYDTLYLNNIVDLGIGELKYYGIIFLFFAQVIIQAKRYTSSYIENRNLLSRLYRINQMKDEFLFDTSQQIRSPLSAITVLSDELLQDGMSVGQKEKVGKINAFSKAASNLVSDVMDYSRLKLGELSIKLEPVNIKVVAENVLQILRRIHRDKHLKEDFPEELPLVYADENRLYQVIYNLARYAISFAPATITIAARVKGGNVELSLTGLGKSGADELSRTLSACVAYNDSREKGGDGFHLGLMIARDLIALQGGTLIVGDEGQGELYFSLPVAEGVPDSSRAELAATCTEHARPCKYAQSPGAGQHVLVADDSPDQLRATTSILEHGGFVVTAVNSGQAAAQLAIEDSGISVVLLDAMMPEMSGYDICREIRRHKTPLSLPILVLTAKTAARDIAMAFEAGANDCLTKPFEKEELLARVRTLVNLKESVDKTIKSEMRYLHAQIKPHFIYNALSVIASMITVKPWEARELIFSFSEYLRSKFVFAESDNLVPLDQEIELVQAYVNIEKARFGDRLDFHVEADSWEIDIPRLILQPLVENAINHGIFNMPQGGRVQLIIERKMDCLSFSVIDNGKGMDKQQVDSLFSDTASRGVGLANINKRLLTLYGHGLSIKSILGQGTEVTFIVPLQARGAERGGE